MNFTKYDNTYPYPKRADFTSTYYYKEGKLVAVSKGMDLDHKFPEILLKDCTKEVIVDQESFRNEHDKYYENGNKLKQQFKEDLADELSLTGNPKWDKLFDIAWNEGHSSGFYEVYYWADKLSELIN